MAEFLMFDAGLLIGAAVVLRFFPGLAKDAWDGAVAIWHLILG